MRKESKEGNKPPPVKCPPGDLSRDIDGRKNEKPTRILNYKIALVAHHN